MGTCVERRDEVGVAAGHVRAVGVPGGRSGGDIGERWGRCKGRSRGDPGEIQWRYGGDLGEIWGRHGGDMGETWGEYWGDVGEILGRYGGDIGQIWGGIWGRYTTACHGWVVEPGKESMQPKWVSACLGLQVGERLVRVRVAVAVAVAVTVGSCSG